MAAAAGRKMRIKYLTSAAATPAVIAGARTDSFTINNEPIDITDKDDVGIVTLLDDIATKQVEMTVEGVLTNGTLVSLAANTASGAALHLMQFAIQSVGTLAGSFFMNSFQGEGAEGGDPATFTASFQSSGAVTLS